MAELLFFVALGAANSLCALLGAWIARNRRRAPWVWTALCFLLGPIGLGLLLGTRRPRPSPLLLTDDGGGESLPASDVEEVQTCHPRPGNTTFHIHSPHLLPAHPADADSSPSESRELVEAPFCATSFPARRPAVREVAKECPCFQLLARDTSAVRVLCPKCTHQFRRPAGLVGKLEKCPECQVVMQIPA